MASDGYMSLDNRHMILTSVDIENVENMRQILGLSNCIGRTTSGAGRFAHRLQFGDVALYDFFKLSGIHNAKSKTILQVSVPDSLFADFFRGLFDGDGSIWGYRDIRWRSSYMYYTSICSASRPFLVWLQRKLKFLAGTQNGTVSESAPSRAYQLRYAKVDSRQLFKYMYYQPDLPQLGRKYRKFVDFLSSDPYNNMVT